MTLTVLQLLYVIAVDTSLVVSFTFTNETKRRKISLSVPETSLTTTWDGEEEGEEFKEEDKSEEEDKGVKREEKRGRKKDKKYRKGGSGISLKWTTKYALLPKPTGPKLGLLFVTSELQRSSTQFMDPILTLIGLHGKRENCRAQAWKWRRLK